MYLHNVTVIVNLFW